MLDEMIGVGLREAAGLEPTDRQKLAIAIRNLERARGLLRDASVQIDGGDGAELVADALAVVTVALNTVS